MKQWTFTTVSSFFKYAGKLVLTLMIVLVFLFALERVMKIHALFLASRSQNTSRIYVGNTVPSASRSSTIHPFWPEFPRSSAGSIRSAVINGTQTLTEEWECHRTPGEVLSYYRDQMTARGWQDVTEETYGLQIEGQESVNALQDERYLTKYRNVMDSNLVLSRHDWSMHISTEPSKQGVGQITIKIYAAATPSITKFFEGVGSSLLGAGNRAGKPLEAVQQGADGSYHTTISIRKEPQAQAFQEALADLESKGWKPVVVLPRQQARPGFSAWLVKGNQYAMLSVSPLPQGQGSSVTLTEVTPE